MRYYALYSDNKLIAIGTGYGGTEITEAEYNALLAEIREKAALVDKLYSGEITLDAVPAEWQEEIQRRVDERIAAAYDSSTGTVTIPEVTGDIVITANAIANARTITYVMTYAASSNTAAIVNDGDSYTTTISANAGYALSTVTVTMGGTDITDSTYNADTGIVSIASVTGDVVITAVAVVSRTDVLRQSVASDGTPYNGGTGYKSGYRLNSSGNESAASGVYCSGFIPMTNAQTIEFEGISLPAVSGVGNSFYTIHFYNSTFTRIAMTQYQAHNVFPTASIGTGTKDDSGKYIKTFKPTGVSGLAYIRFSCGMIDDNSKVYVYDN